MRNAYEMHTNFLCNHKHNNSDYDDNENAAENEQAIQPNWTNNTVREQIILKRNRKRKTRKQNKEKNCSPFV